MDLRNNARQSDAENSRVENLSADELRRAYAELSAERMALLKENEHLRTKCQALETTRDRYEDLYDFAPFGYLCLDESGIIHSANLTAASMLDLDRQQLIGEYLTVFIKQDQRQDFYDIRQALMNSSRRQACDLVLSRSDGSGVDVRMSLLLMAEDSRHEIRIAIQNSTEIQSSCLELENSRKRLLELYRHVQSLREQEKYTFSRAIHDELSQVLAVLKMELSWVEEHLHPENTRVREQFENLRKLLDHTIRASKQITSELRPYMLDELGLASAIKWAAKEFKNRSGIETELDFEATPEKLDKDRSTAAFRIVQELLANTEQHANASMVSIRMHIGNQCLVLDFSDNGCGINPAQISSTSSFGLMAIRERTHEFGGNVTIAGEQGKGTRITVRIPMRAGETAAQRDSD